MANTIDDLYLKYTNKVGKTLENDRYFQYLYEIIQNSSNTFQHTNQVLHKVVDEQWLTTIEDSLEAINNIIEKPRRFVTTKEEVVPVALAKKITADSVRHLSMNTQFIASDVEGEIMPTRIMNVSTEESYDLYENRFIYHLIQRLVTFIDKRTDVIFWSTGDETCNYMSLTSEIDDAYEQIEYKLEMKVKNKKSIVDNNNDNMSVYMRIDHVRRLVMALRNSSFCSLMAGCSKVHSPIQRTNLMMKDPNYRTCYKLWHFLESYDEVGYSIDTIQTPLEFDEEYMIQMYTNLITNYTVFKSLLESDSRKLAEIGPVKKKHIKPKFIKQVHEEVVDDPNLPDVEIKQVFIEEVTEAQLAAEAEVERLSQELETEKRARESAEAASEESMMQVGQLMQQNIELQGMYTNEQEARENAEAERDQITREAEEALAESESRRQQELQEAESRRQQELQEAESRRQQELQEAESRRQLELRDAESRRQAELATANEKSEMELEALKKQLISEFEEQKKQLIDELNAKHNAELAQLEQSMKLSAENRENELIAKHTKALQELCAEADNRVSYVTAQGEAKLKEVSDEFNTRIVALNTAKDSAEKRLVKETEKLEHEKQRADSERLRADEADKKRLEAEDKLRNRRRIFGKNKTNS